MKEESMTEHEAEDIKTLFRDSDLEHVPVSRDLIGPAVAWGNGRRRRDRWAAAGVAGAVAAVAVAGVVTLRPGGAGGSGNVEAGDASTHSTAKPTVPKPSATSTTTTPAPIKLSGTISQREQELLDALQPYLPAGDRITCLIPGQDHGFCSTMMFTSPSGTSIGQWLPGTRFIQPAPVDEKYIHEHKATAAIPLVSGTIDVPGGTVQIESTDTEAQDNVAEKATLTDPTALCFHTALYVFIPTGSTTGITFELTELVREMPWKPGSEMPNDHGVWGFNSAGPVLSPEQFAKLVTAPIFPSVFDQLHTLQSQAMAQAQHQQSHSPH
jgi:hypothetical protein